MSDHQDFTDLSGARVEETRAEETISAEEEEVSSTWGLRLRNSMDKLSDQTSPLIPYNPSALHLNELYIQGMVYLLRFLNLSAQFLQFMWVLFGNVGRGVKRSFQEDIYVFFKGSSYPYFIKDVYLNLSGVPEVEWYYNSATHTFLTNRLYNNSQNYHTRHIPYLSAEVKYNDLTLYDVSEFVNSVRWAGEDGETMPNVDHLISAWSLSSGIILKRSEQMNLSVINTDGDEVKLSLRNEA